MVSTTAAAAPRRPPSAPPPRRALRALGNANYRLYFFGQIVSQTGGWLQRIAQSWLILDLTSSPAALGILTVAQFLPIMVLSLFAGVVADRLPKRPLLYAIGIISSLQAVAMTLLVLSGHIQPWQVYVLAFVLGVVSAFEMPTRQAFLSELVAREELQSAISLNSSVFNGARIIGPGIGGVIIAAWGVAWCFGLNAISFLASLISLYLLDMRNAHGPLRPPRGALLTQLADGLRYAARTPELSFPLLLLACIGTFGYNFGVTFPLLARYGLGLDAVGFGSLNTAMGIGSLVGALGVAARLSPTRNALLISGGAFSALLLLVAIIPWYAVTLLALAAMGVASVTYSAVTNTSLQLNSEEQFRGRVLSLYTLLFAGSTPIGGAITGWIADRWGIRDALGVEAVVCLVAVAAGLLWTFRRARAEPTDG
ncbi:MAG TPA: MFS transporter [Chloroflexota bacterium]|nr:MFS transporter [Chloroflexota bacterium]